MVYSLKIEERHFDFSSDEMEKYLSENPECKKEFLQYWIERFQDSSWYISPDFESLPCVSKSKLYAFNDWNAQKFQGELADLLFHF